MSTDRRQRATAPVCLQRGNGVTGRRHSANKRKERPEYPRPTSGKAIRRTHLLPAIGSGCHGRPVSLMESCRISDQSLTHRSRGAAVFKCYCSKFAIKINSFPTCFPSRNPKMSSCGQYVLRHRYEPLRSLHRLQPQRHRFERRAHLSCLHRPDIDRLHLLH